MDRVQPTSAQERRARRLVAVEVPAGLGLLPRSSTRILVVVLAVVVVMSYSNLPFLSPALIRDHPLSLKTQIDSDGICLQSTPSTCGPAAAATALGVLDTPSRKDNSRLPLMPVLSWEPRRMFSLNRCSGSFRKKGACGIQGIFKDRGDSALRLLPGRRQTQLSSQSLCHRAGNSEKRAVVGDPLQGRIVLNREEFADRWRFTGIELKKRCSVGSAAGKAQCVVHDG